MEIEIKFEPVSNGDWCLVLIYPDFETGNEAYLALGDYKTTLVLTGHKLAVLVTISDKLPILAEQGLNSVQKSLIDNQQVKYLSTGYRHNGQLSYHHELPINLQTRG